jgi:hypothetical protein
MLEQLTSTYPQRCLMNPDRVDNVGEMISSLFPQVRMTGQLTPEGKMAVVFEIPREGIYMPDFYKEFSYALNRERTA